MGTIARYGGKAAVTPRGSKAPVKTKTVDGTREVELPVGDGKARVHATRGLKHWESVSDYGNGGGCTVEATVTVELTCGQSAEEIKSATSAAGGLAEELTLKAIKDMGEYLQGYMKKLTGGGS